MTPSSAPRAPEFATAVERIAGAQLRDIMITETLTRRSTLRPDHGRSVACRTVDVATDRARLRRALLTEPWRMLMPSYEQNLSPVLRSGGIRLRTHVPEDFETLYQIDRLCYEPEIAYSRRELRDYLQLPGAECVVAGAIESGLHRSYKTHSQAKDYKRTAQIAGFCITAHQDAW